MGLHFFFSFDLSYLKVSKKRRLAGTPEVWHRVAQNLLQSALSFCRMVLRGIE